ncbi:hypothetical protein [Flavobacterium macacae]|uniref:Uncharacterized protein n=1 Tax=Flavobacterium macacae TaxID=2488993 RepID=A0A3P3VXH1_9FLAO|nr:hypothetical protein [Flavobacterium macacae]RRJ87390.1 hypothetical protein EG849_15365 [Flavobacterium macacae]
MKSKIVEMDLMKQNSASSHCQIKFQKIVITKNRRNYEDHGKTDSGCEGTTDSWKYFNLFKMDANNCYGNYCVLLLLLYAQKR